jgi:hypothetical protein
MTSKKEYKKLDDEHIVTLIDDNVKRSVGYYDSEISVERTRVYDFYNSTLPKPAHDGNSKYVSQSVWNQVESMKAALLETFSSGSKIVKFDPQDQNDVQNANIATAYADYVAFRQNDLYSVMQSVIHDGLVARNGIAKVFWDSKTDFTTEYFEDLSQDEFDLLIAEDTVEIVEQIEDEIGLMSGSINVYRDSSQVTIETIAPEEFLIEPQAMSLDTVNFCAHRTRKTLSELRMEGYDEKLIDKIGDHSDVDQETDPEVLARHDQISSDRGFNASGYQDQVRSVQVIEAYIMLDVDGKTGVAELYRVIKAGNSLLDKRKVNRKPFVSFAPLPIPHAFFGANFGDKVVPTQAATTVLTRSILDHAMITNNPRYTVIKGGLSNPRELIDNRVGGIVNVTRPDAIAPMMQSQLNPFVYQTLKLLDENLEDATGVSRISQGTNKDAVSKQNSAAMIESLASMSQQRQKVIARNFATQFLKPLYQEIYQLVIENEEEEKIIELAGQYITVDPASWTDRRDISISLHLGYGEQATEAEKYLGMHTNFSQDPNLARMYQPENQYALVSKIMDLTGIKNVAEYLTPPDQLPPEEPDQMAQMQMEMSQKQIEIQERNTAVAEMKAQVDAEISKMKMELESLKAENQYAIQSDNVDLKEAQLAHKKRIDAAELELASRADEIMAIASPNG